MNDTQAVTLDLDPWDRRFLENFFGAVADGGCRRHLAARRSSDPATTRKAIRAYEAITAGAEAGTIEVDDEVRRRAIGAARAADRESEWDRLTREHLAFRALVDQLSEVPA